MICPHDLIEREEAVTVDGLCAQCLLLRMGAMQALLRVIVKTFNIWDGLSTKDVRRFVDEAEALLSPGEEAARSQETP